MNTTSDGGNQQGRGLRGDPVADRGQADGTRDTSSPPTLDPAALRVLLTEAEKVLAGGYVTCPEPPYAMFEVRLLCDLASAVEQLLTENHVLEHGYQDQIRLYWEMRNARDAAEAQRDQLRAYAQHKPECGLDKSQGWPFIRSTACTCGLSSLLTPEK